MNQITRPISIEDDLPPLDEWVLAYLADEKVGFWDVVSLYVTQPYLVWSDGTQYIYESVTHWLPLPEPPSASLHMMTPLEQAHFLIVNWCKDVRKIPTH